MVFKVSRFQVCYAVLSPACQPALVNNDIDSLYIRGMSLLQGLSKVRLPNTGLVTDVKSRRFGDTLPSNPTGLTPPAPTRRVAYHLTPPTANYSRPNPGVRVLDATATWYLVTAKYW